MKQSAVLIVLLALTLAACNRQNPAKPATLATPTTGLRADERMVAQATSAAILSARMHKDKDSGVQALDEQMAQLNSGLDERARLLAAAAISAQSTSRQIPQTTTTQQLRQQLDTNTTGLLAHLEQARTMVDGIGLNGTIAGLPAESFREGIRTMLGRLTAEITRISKESDMTALHDIRALQQRLTPAAAKPSASEMTAPSVRVRLRPGRVR